MSSDPETITPETPVLEALKVLADKGFRRLPVVSGGEVVGIVTDKDLKDAMPGKATTLSVWELNYLLSKLKVSEVMSRPLITAQADELMEDIALRLQEYKIGGMPVLRGRALVGMITITDVLRAFTAIFGLTEGGIRLTVDVPDVPGGLDRVLQAILPGNVVSVATSGVEPSGPWRRFVLRVTGTSATSLQGQVERAGIRVIDLRGQGSPEGLR
jgi:acetoin utilization protein AcuB